MRIKTLFKLRGYKMKKTLVTTKLFFLIWKKFLLADKLSLIRFVDFACIELDFVI